MAVGGQTIYAQQKPIEAEAASSTAIAYSQKTSTDENNSPVTRRSQTAYAPITERSVREGLD
jgi:hypothetical protein